MECENSVPREMFEQMYRLALLHIYLISFLIFIWVITLSITMKLKYSNEQLREQIKNHNRTLNSAVVVNNDNYESASHFYEIVT